jgi:hypothetical protein
VERAARQAIDHRLDMGESGGSVTVADFELGGIEAAAGFEFGVPSERRQPHRLAREPRSGTDCPAGGGAPGRLVERGGDVLRGAVETERKVAGLLLGSSTISANRR